MSNDAFTDLPIGAIPAIAYRLVLRTKIEEPDLALQVADFIDFVAVTGEPPPKMEERVLLALQEAAAQPRDRISQFVVATYSDAIAAARAVMASDREMAIKWLYSAVASAKEAARGYGDVSHGISTAFNWDIALACAVGRAENWAPNGLVKPALFGPVWPLGSPSPLYPEPNDKGAELQLEIEVPADASDEQIAQMVTDTVMAMDDLHRAYGGHGLEVRELEIQNGIPCLEGVPQ